jgi:hypothetical protein
VSRLLRDKTLWEETTLEEYRVQADALVLAASRQSG